MSVQGAPEELPQEQELPEELPHEQELPREQEEQPQQEPPQLQPPRREVFLSRMMTRTTAAATAARIATLAKFINKLLYITLPEKGQIFNVLKWSLPVKRRGAPRKTGANIIR